MRFSLIGLAATASLFTASVAGAYCRTITIPLPASYDPATGCYQPAAGEANIPLFWQNACVGYSLQKDASKQISFADATAVAARAFGRWSAYTCKSGGAPSIETIDEGAVSCDKVEYNQNATNQHVIVFRDTSWPHDDPNNTLALTTVTFDTGTGEIYDADMEVNSADNKLSAATPVPAGSFDLDSILTHEAGHFLGLAHSSEPKAVMYAHYKPGSTSLTSDDGEGMCAIDAPNGDRATAAGTTAQTACDATPRHGYGTGCGGADAVSPETTGGGKSGGCSVAPGKSAGGGSFAWIAALGLAGAFAGRRARARREAGAIVRRMRRARAAFLSLVIGASVVGAASFVARDASASVSIAVLFDDLVHDSTAAALVTPVEQTAVWEDGRIYTYTRVKVDAVAAGSMPGGDAWVRTMGGTVGKIGQLVDGEAVLSLGKQGLLFLQPLVVNGQTTTTFDVTARAQGQFPVLVDAATKKPKVMRAGVTGSLVDPPKARFDRVMLARTQAGAAPKAELARDVLHGRDVDDAVHAVVDAWARLHAKK